MMKDIVPYTGEEAEKLAKGLARVGVPCIGPTTGIELLKVVTGLDAFIKNQELTPDMRVVLSGYRSRIMDVLCVCAFQQKETLDHLEKLIRSESPSGQKG